MPSDSSSSSLLRRGAECYGISLDDSSLSRLISYYSLVQSWNTRMNLVSKGDLDRFFEYHILDSLKVACFVDFSLVRTFLDFGTGAGLPGIPIAISFPHLNGTLVDSRLKRITFLENAARELKLKNISVIRARIENLESFYNDTFDLVISRATTNLCDFYTLTSRFIHSGGSLVAIKGSDIADEFNDLLHCADTRLFHISSTVPPECDNVRRGTIVKITRL